MTAPLDDEFTELTDAQIDRVDLVKSPANGRPFVLMKKADDGLTQPLIPAGMVADLIKRADDQETPAVTAPAPVEKAELDVTDAPAADELIPEVPGGTTAATVPGSPDWEQLDGDTAMNAVAVLGRLKGVLGWLSDREAQEAVTGGDYDADGNSWDLDSMACALDAMISDLAGFAVGEHMEAEEVAKAAQTLAAVTAPLAVVEGFAPIAKAGRTLSAANETQLRNAAASIETVLNSLPQAPAAATDDGTAVTKETAVATVPKTITVDVVPQFVTADGEPIAKGTDLAAAMLAGAPVLAAADVLGVLVNGGRTVDVAKAAGDPQLAVFDADGKLIGTIDPAKLSPIATSPAAAEKADEPAADDGTEGDVAPADPAAAPADPAATPAAPATEATIPGTATVQSPPEQDPNDVAKAAAAQFEELVQSIVAKQVADLAAGQAALQERVEKMGQQPDNRRSPVLNGATGIAGAVTRDGDQGDEKFAELRKAVDEAKTEGQRADARAALAYAKVAARFER